MKVAKQSGFTKDLRTLCLPFSLSICFRFSVTGYFTLKSVVMQKNRKSCLNMICLPRLCAVLKALGNPPATTIRVRERHYSVETLSPIGPNAMTARSPSGLTSIALCPLQDRYFANICLSYGAHDHPLLPTHPSMSIPCRILVTWRARIELRQTERSLTDFGLFLRSLVLPVREIAAQHCCKCGWN